MGRLDHARGSQVFDLAVSLVFVMANCTGMLCCQRRRRAPPRRKFSKASPHYINAFLASAAEVVAI